MKRLLAVALLALIASSAFAQTTTITALPAGTTLTGTEAIPMDQTGGCTGNTCKTTPSAVTTYVNTHATIPLATGVSGNLPITNAPSIASPTVIGNYSGSTATASALNPLQLANMQSAVISAVVVTTTNNTLTGAQTIDGISVGNGQTVLVAGQTTASANGIYISATGAWTRAANFPAGYVIAQNCDLSVLIESGTFNTGNVGTHYRLLTSGGTITIGTTAQTWQQVIYNQASSTLFGTVKTTAGSIVASSLAAPNAANDCAAFGDAFGSMQDIGNWQFQTGPCVVSDVNGHPLISLGISPVITGTGCAIADTTKSSDNSGAVTATGADTCIITFSGTGGFAGYTTLGTLPHCVVSGLSATVLPFISTAPTATSFQVHTAAAGTFSYICL